jgi:C4-dicarboxylate transporter DctM subunit
MITGFFIILAALLVVGVPIFISLSGAVLVSMWWQGGLPLTIIIERLFAGLDKFSLMSIPFFILTGNLMNVGGLSRRIVHLANLMVGRFTGGMGMTAVSSSMFFSAISGSSPATVVAVGSLLYPALNEQGYKRSFSIGVIIASGSIGIIIPPSIVMIVYAAVTGVSVGALFMAGIGAGVLYGLCFFPYCYYRARRDGVARSPAPSARELWRALKDAAWGMGVPVVVLGGIYGGVFTPTEAAAVAVIYAFAVAVFVYREKTMSEMFGAIVNSATTTAQVMIILASASVLSWFLTSNGIAVFIAEKVLSVSANPYYIFLLINVTVLIWGMFLDAASIMVILAPLFYTVGLKVGINPIHLGVVLTVNGAIGMFTPPFGLNLFVASSVGDVDYLQAVRGALPFIGLAIIALALLTYFPDISMLLPRMVYAGV